MTVGSHRARSSSKVIEQDCTERPRFKSGVSRFSSPMGLQKGRGFWTYDYLV